MQVIKVVDFVIKIGRLFQHARGLWKSTTEVAQIISDYLELQADLKTDPGF